MIPIKSVIAAVVASSIDDGGDLIKILFTTVSIPAARGR
jgi:hypothetical protein